MLICIIIIGSSLKSIESFALTARVFSAALSVRITCRTLKMYSYHPLIPVELFCQVGTSYSLFLKTEYTGVGYSCPLHPVSVFIVVHYTSNNKSLGKDFSFITNYTHKWILKMCRWGNDLEINLYIGEEVDWGRRFQFSLEYCDILTYLDIS